MTGPQAGVRLPAVGGLFYDSDPARLREQLERCFMHPVGPGRLPAPWGERRLRGLIVPHAAITYSGPVAAHAYFRLAGSSRPSLVIAVGPDHHGAGPALSLAPPLRWRTPLGEVATEHSLREVLAGLGVPTAAGGHLGEHSIEVQLPFLQFIGYQGPVVPIAMADQSLASVERLACALVTALREGGASADREALLLASSDLSHYLPRREAERIDRALLEAIGRGSGSRLIEEVTRTGAMMCGAGPAAVAIDVAHRLGCGGTEVLRYATSADTGGGPDAVVGYAAVALEAA